MSTLLGQLRFGLATALIEAPFDLLFRWRLWFLYDIHLRLFWRRRIKCHSDPDVDLGFRAILTTTSGIFLVSGRQATRLLNGRFTGLTRYRDHFYASEERTRLKRNRIISFRLSNERAVEVNNFYAGSNRGGFHQIDFVGAHLYITDTNNNRILVVNEEGKFRYALYPNGIHTENRPNQELDRDYYCHYNSVLAKGEKVLILANNATNKCGRPSLVYEIDRENFRSAVVEDVEGANSHNLLVHSGMLLICDSLNGELVDKASGRVLFKTEFFTRGLAMNESYTLIGGSDLERRQNRERTDARFWVLDREFRQVSAWNLGRFGQVYEIRLLGTDYGLSNQAAVDNHPATLTPDLELTKEIGNESTAAA